jgi:hypothetical protein
MGGLTIFQIDLHRLNHSIRAVFKRFGDKTFGMFSQGVEVHHLMKLRRQKNASIILAPIPYG